MKRQARFVILQAASADRTAARIFLLTRRTFIITMLACLVLLTAAPFSSDPQLAFELGSELFHAAFRVAVIGTVTGFTADIVLRQSRR